MADGQGCTCYAYGPSECACAADWTPQEIYDLRAEVKRLKTALRKIAIPALGGKSQQAIAQLALKQIGKNNAKL